MKQSSKYVMPKFVIFIGAKKCVQKWKRRENSVMLLMMMVMVNEHHFALFVFVRNIHQFFRRHHVFVFRENPNSRMHTYS